MDPWTGEGFTEAKLAGILRNMDGRDVVVNVNSPGGDVYQGLAMYNILADYKGHVTARVLGLAASAASFVVMAANKVEIGKAAAMMIHNTQSGAAGDRNVLRAAADWMENFDNMLAGIYAEKTGKDVKAIGKMLDATTWLYGQQAVGAGFADGLLSVDDTTREDSTPSNAVREVEKALRAKGLSRSEAMTIIAKVKTALSDSGAANVQRDSVMGDAANPIAELLEYYRKGQNED